MWSLKFSHMQTLTYTNILPSSSLTLKRLLAFREFAEVTRDQKKLTALMKMCMRVFVCLSVCVCVFVCEEFVVIQGGKSWWRKIEEEIVILPRSPSFSFCLAQSDFLCVCIHLIIHILDIFRPSYQENFHWGRLLCGLVLKGRKHGSVNANAPSVFSLFQRVFTHRISCTVTCSLSLVVWSLFGTLAKFCGITTCCVRPYVVQKHTQHVRALA